MSGLLAYKWSCSACGRDLRVSFTRKDGKPSRSKRIMIGAVSVAISVHVRACSDQGRFATFCAECSQAGLLEEFVEARRLLIAPDAPGAMAAEGKQERPAARVPCRGCAAVFVWDGHRDEHERTAHPGLNPNSEWTRAEATGAVSLTPELPLVGEVLSTRVRR